MNKVATRLDALQQGVTHQLDSIKDLDLAGLDRQRIEHTNV